MFFIIALFLCVGVIYTSAWLQPQNRLCKTKTISLAMSSFARDRTNYGGDAMNNNFNNFNNNNNMKNSMNNNMRQENEDEEMENREERSTVPSRTDTCMILLSGIVGTEPKEAYLSNGHYVINFSLAVVGHYTPVHEWERFKPTETMWMNSEIWDDLAKEQIGNIRKGSKFSGIGKLILNKWTDKTSGEERKLYKSRILKIMQQDELDNITESMELDNENGSNDFNNYDQEMSNDMDQTPPPPPAPTRRRRGVDNDRDPRIPF